jgi:hypothetical protein
VSPPLCRPDLLLREPGCVFQRLLDVLPLQVGVIAEHLVPARAMGDLADDHGHRNAHPPNRGSPPENLGVKGNSVERRYRFYG